MNNCKSEKTGYASIDRPWSEFYKNIPQNNLFLNTTPYQGLFDNNKNYPTETAIEYFGKKICYGTLFKNIDAAARALVKCGVKKGDFVTICSTTTPEVIYTFYAISKIGAVANIISPFYSESDFISRINECGSDVILIVDKFMPRFLSVFSEHPTKKIIILPMMPFPIMNKPSRYNLQN